MLLANYTSSARRGAGYALKFSAAWVVGAAAPWILLPLVESAFADTRGGDAVGYAVLGVVAALGAACGAVFLWRSRTGGATVAGPASRS
jgi:hypothetical protein